MSHQGRGLEIIVGADYEDEQNILEIMNDDGMSVGAGSPCPPPIYRPDGSPTTYPGYFVKVRFKSGQSV